MKELIERLEAAEGGDLVLEREMMDALFPAGMPDEFRPLSFAPMASLDAALALAERVLPGWEFGTYINRPDINGRRFTKVEAHRWQDVSPEYEFACASSQAPTPALALCIAILKAKSA